MPKPLNILFFDLEVHPKSKQILEYGAIFNDNQHRGKQKEKFEQFAQSATTICGHNILHHDLPILQLNDFRPAFFQKNSIDTLYLSVLLFPKKPYHPLVKGYQLDGQEMNNPLADAFLTKELLEDLLVAYQQVSVEIRTIYYFLLKDLNGFAGFFQHVSTQGLASINDKNGLAEYIQDNFANYFCGATNLLYFIEKQPIELAFALANILVGDAASLLPYWVQNRFPETNTIVNELRTACTRKQGCAYCRQLSPNKALKQFFGFENFRKFEGDGEIPLQEQVVNAALANDSFLTIFPTGGGKSLTFQLPALMRGKANRSLTVVISPLQSLMKDQVDVLRNRHDITSAVTINGMLSPLERSEAIERVEKGGANLLYISPESLRSKTIISLFSKRIIDRFVIDEAHCFSSWGQDFRVDYLYIGKFLKKLQATKRLENPIPVSCFTATAKPAVIDDICHYFQETLGLKLAVYQTGQKRKNLHYYVIKTDGEEEKYEKLVELIQSSEGPKIVYVSRVKRAEELTWNLQREGLHARFYHGQMEREDKVRIQNEFMAENSDLEVIVATSAFGMGVDKDNVQMVIHYNISDSLENYMQESGRAGRQANLQAKCYVLFDKTDLDAHFNLMNLTKLSQKEVYQIWQGIKLFKNKKFTKSALEIAKNAGWDTEMRDLETRVKVALSALEESGYVVREENAPQIFAQSILVKNVEEAQLKMQQGIHHFIGNGQYEKAKRIFSSLISRAKTGRDTRVDSIAESLAIPKHEVTSILNIFKELNILSNDKDLTAYYFTVQGKRNSVHVFNRVGQIELEMFNFIFPTENIDKKNIFLRELNEAINEKGIECDLKVIREILNYWAQVNYIRKERIDRPNNQYRIQLNLAHEKFEKNLMARLKTTRYCLTVLQKKYLPKAKIDENFTDKKLIHFSVLDLKQATEKLTGKILPMQFYEFLLLYCHHLNIIELKDGLMVFYNPMKITRQIENNRKQYTQEDYQQLENYYQSKTEQIHIVGEYAKKQLQNTVAATQFVEDYFSLDYDKFLTKYFNRHKTRIRRPITEEKFKRIFGELSSEQLNVVKDNKNDNILVAAGPGSGKTRVLVHKVASLLLMEDVKPEQFLMLTFSKPAALEFKNRLKDLVGTIAYQIDIFTYHGFAFQLAGRIGDLEKSKNILAIITEAIRQEDILLERIQSKSVLVVDEYQDVSREEYEFITAIANKAEKIRIIAAGDDDQNIYEFRGSSIQYMRDFITKQQAIRYFLTINYRAKHNLLAFTNLYLKTKFSNQRIKHDIPLVAHKQQNGKIEIIKYQSRNLILPLLQHLKKQDLSGTTAVLTYKNEEAILITSLLKKEGFPASLISDKQGFTLRDLLEIKTFTHFIFKDIKDDFGLITNEKWAASKDQLWALYPDSENLDLVKKIINAFEKTKPKKFKSEWRSFLKEGRVEDFYHPEKKTILVSTMHKAKGKEFDTVFVLLNQYPLHTAEKKRALYVAMTRAKDQLFLHTNNIDFDKNDIENLTYQEDITDYTAPNTIILETGMKDIWLGFVKKNYVMTAIKALESGSQLVSNQSDLSIFETTDKQAVVKLSRNFEDRLNGYLQQGYQLESIIAQYIVVWYDEDTDQSFRVVLPKIICSKILN